MTTEILRGIIGSQAYHLATPESDTDRLAIHIAATKDFLGLNTHQSITHTIHSTAPDFTSHEIGKFCHLALRSNPTLLELLWLDSYETQTPAGKLLTTNPNLFPSTQVVRKAYGGWATSEAHKIIRIYSHNKIEEADNPHRIAKRARHALRVSIQGLLLLQTGEVILNMTDYREEIFAAGELAISQPETFIEIIEDHTNKLDNTKSVLPQEPNREAVNKILQEIRTQQILDDIQK